MSPATDNALRKSVHLQPETTGPPRHTLAPILGNLTYLRFKRHLVLAIGAKPYLIGRRF